MIKGITCDSRRIKEGYIFVCLKGSKDNGYRYIKEAEARGAAAIIADSSVHCSIPVILCCNPRRKMAELAKRIYDRVDEKLTLIGVTGTNGKTTVTHLIRDVLVEAHKKTALIGTNGCYYNYFLTDESFTTATTPEAAELWKVLKNMYELGSGYAVCEVSSHALISDRVWGADFDVGVFTNLTCEHLDFHKNMENYFLAKQMLMQTSKFCVINTDDEYGKRLYKRFFEKAVSIGFCDADITAENIHLSVAGLEFVLNDRGEKNLVKIGLIGNFSVYNALCAYAVCRHLDIDKDTILKAFENTTGVRGRAERVQIDANFSVIIDYAHTPDGLENIIKALKEITAGRILVVFGCGGERDRSKRALMGKISGELADFTVITSDNPRGEEPVKIIKEIEKGICEVSNDYIIIPDRYKAIEYALNLANAGDTVLLAGKGHEDYILENEKKIHFDEREIIFSILNKE